MGRRLAPLRAAYPVTLIVTSREAGSINISEVSKTRFLEVVRALGIKALMLPAIVLSGLEAIVIRLTASFFAVVENVVAVIPPIRTIAPAVRITVRISPPTPISESKRTIDAIGVRADDHDSPTLCL